MVSFLHAADLHLGLRITRFEGEHADKIRDARFQAMEKMLTVAKERQVDFILIAGDLFDDAAMDGTTARRAFHMLEEASCPVYVLPGNHDPLLPGSVWERKPWAGAETEGVVVLRQSEPVQAVEGAVLFPCPVFRKTSLEDPTGWIPVEPGQKTREGVRIGIAHGSVKDREGLPADDHLIDPQAAATHGLDYLALGHWHAARQFTSQEGCIRTAYAGVHEPIGFPKGAVSDTGWLPYAEGGDREEFVDDGRGAVLLVTIDGPGGTPRIETAETGALRWQAEQRSLYTEEDLSGVIQEIAGRPDPSHTVLRLQLEGVLGARAMLRLDELREILRGRYLHGEMDVSALRLEPSEEEIREVAGRGVLRTVLERLKEGICAGEGAPDGSEEARKAEIAERAMLLLHQIGTGVGE